MGRDDISFSKARMSESANGSPAKFKSETQEKEELG